MYSRRTAWPRIASDVRERAASASRRPASAAWDSRSDRYEIFASCAARDLIVSTSCGVVTDVSHAATTLAKNRIND
jgi:hypothetical protein